MLASGKPHVQQRATCTTASSATKAEVRALKGKRASDLGSLFITLRPTGHRHLPDRQSNDRSTGSASIGRSSKRPVLFC
jgi:hypothetical protein